MQICSLGATGLTVSRLGLGLAALGRPGYINLGHSGDLAHNYAVTAMAEQTATVLDAAWQAGVRYFDAARSYGRAEEFLGNWLRTRQIASAAVTVGSKWGYSYTAGWQVEAAKHEIKEHSLPVLQRQWQESQTHVGPWLRLYQVHSATLDSGLFTQKELLNELAHCKAAGVVIGLSLSGPQQAKTLEQALQVQVDGVPLFACVQATWNLLERSVAPLLQAAQQAGLGVIVKEALANGRLTVRNRDPDFAPALVVLNQQAERLQTTLDALALAAVLAQPWANVVLSGAATVAQLRSNLAALSVVWDQTAEDALRVLTEAPAAYWQKRSQLAWN